MILVNQVPFNKHLIHTISIEDEPHDEGDNGSVYTLSYEFTCPHAKEKQSGYVWLPSDDRDESIASFLSMIFKNNNRTDIYFCKPCSDKNLQQ